MIYHNVWVYQKKKKIIGLLTSVGNASNHTNCVSFTSQKYTIQPTLINLHSNEYTQAFRYYPLVVNLDKCLGRCNALNGLSEKVCAPNEIEDFFKAYILWMYW